MIDPEQEIIRLREKVSILQENQACLMALLAIYSPDFWNSHSCLLTQRPKTPVPEPQAPEPLCRAQLIRRTPEELQQLQISEAKLGRTVSREHEEWRWR